MKHFTLTFIVFGSLLFACNQKKSNKQLATENKPADTVKNGTQKQEKNDSNNRLENDKIKSIKNLIALFKVKNIDEISNKIKFPLNREYPIPPIKNKEEFKQRFSEVFDKILIDKIADAKIGQWSEIGWRGIMFDNGILWMANSDGIITSINYQSGFEKKQRKALIDKEKENLHVSLKTFESPIYKIKTNDYLIRIDQLINEKYRYSSWKISDKESSKPDIIIVDGEFEFEGSGGNHVITFINGVHTYKIYRTIIGQDNSPDITLEIEKDGKKILSEDGTIIFD